MTIDRLHEIAAAAHHTGGDDCVVVVISPSNRRRIAVAELVGSQAPVLLVSSRAEAARMFEVAALDESSEPRQVVEQAVEPVAEPLVELDSEGRVIRVADQSVGLSPLEHDLLTVLLETPGRICPYADLHERVWGHSYELARDDVASVVKRLREKLRRLRSPARIEAVRGVGLRLIRERG
jgi:Transcriptional regulatory protein, C terminal